MKLYKKKKSQFWYYDFAVAGKRYRGSTEETNRNRATTIASIKMSKLIDAGDDPIPKKSPTLDELAVKFLGFVDQSGRESKTKTYYKTGWRLLESASLRNMQSTPLRNMRIDGITAEVLDIIDLPGSPSNANCALRTLRRMLRLAEGSWGLIRKTPKFVLRAEQGRELLLDEVCEQKLLAAAKKLKWRKKTFELFRDVVALMRETGMRNERELFQVLIENVDRNKKVIFVPESKTAAGRREVPITNRALDVLVSRIGERRAGWLFPSKRNKTGHLKTMNKYFRIARRAAKLPEDLVLYCGRHDFGTTAMNLTGNLAMVMKAMGQKDVKTAMRYQHPDTNTLREAMNNRGSRQQQPARYQ
ncbi:MAG TPA: site-specific integrase [Candidatus Angelobacter sp.]|jgi:integrase|nr:site-specific integrase [Candidatus Angelobacter sp.]